MAVIYLRHPQNGQKVASTEMEAKHDRENGWTDFDPYEGKEDAQEALPSFLGGAGASSDLPADFPGREPLIEAGLTSWAVVQTKTRDELLAVKGIGPATADNIIKALDV